MTDKTISIVVAVSANGIIGRDGALPWHLPSDLRRFKALTLGKPVVMGRKTWASIGRALPGRPNIVISRSRDFEAPGAVIARSLDEAIDTATAAAVGIGADEICIIGGGEIYRQAIGRVDTIHVTEVAVDVEGDTRFPPIDPLVFDKVFEETIPQGEKDSHAMHFATWRRRDAAN